MYKIKTKKFSGPLDLLLQLIEGKELEITEISLAEVTDQYVEYIEKMKDKPAEKLSDFLVIAAKLLLLKSKAILPVTEDEIEPDELEKQLKIYREYYEAGKVLDKMLKQENFSYSREKPPVRTEIEFNPPKNLSKIDLKKAFVNLIKKLDPLVKLPKVSMEKAISLKRKILNLQNSLSRFRKLDFAKLNQKAKSKTEVIVNFLALLELMKQKNVEAEQKGLFENILVKKT